MYYKNEADETLVMLTLAGEQSAYEALVIRYQKAVIASAITITKNQFMAEDAAQDAFVTAWMKLNTLQEPKKYGSWVCRIAKNCALNMISRYRSFLPLDVVDNLNIMGNGIENPAELCALSEERNEVNKSIEMLPEKVRQIIHLHYYENLSIAEIADRMRISEGTVKRQLHDGRKRIRKELCAMNEKYNDTLVQRVMKKVEELKLWQVKNDKSGFEKVYDQVLREVEELPECVEKQHALADVLMRGWWWLPGEKNDALFARIADAAMEGKNEEVMTFIVSREDSKVYDSARIEFIRDKQIPRLEKAGFVKALGHEWFWLGYYLFREKRVEEAKVAYDKVEKILSKEDAYRILLPYARKMEEILATDYKDKNEKRYRIAAQTYEYRLIDNEFRLWNSNGYGHGYIDSVDTDVMRIIRNSSCCDGKFFADISLGETFEATDGATLTFASDNETVETPCGKFENCQLWITKLWDSDGKSIFKSYYKDGVGIVRHEHTKEDITETYSLKSYHVKNAKGLLPLDEGNTWEYASQYAPEFVASELVFTVSFADDDKVIFSSWENSIRNDYDENSWLEAIQNIRCEYYGENKGTYYLRDITPTIERAERLAVTPMEKAHTKMLASVARRIISTDQTLNPDSKTTGHWNFFFRGAVQKKKDSLYLHHNYRWHFEWKNTGYMEAAEYPILVNDVLSILQDATNCIWSDEWYIGATPIVEYTKYSSDIKTQITCEDGGTVTTKAGTFENCFKLCLDIGGMSSGLSYREGKKNYYFADGIGIVRVENEYCGGARTAVYELTSYEGVGEGFMPLCDGFVRRYDGIGFTDGFVGAVEYTYVADGEGDIVIFADRTGVRELPPPVTQYGAIEGEVEESKLCSEGKWDAVQMKNGVNNFHIMLHLIARPAHNRNNAERSIKNNGFNMELLRLLGDDGEIPPAWLGVYAWRTLIRAAAYFGNKQKEEGYEHIEIALNICERIAKFEKGELLDVGRKYLLGGVKYEYGRGLIHLPDGTREPVSYQWELNYNASNLYYALTTPWGWEWFNSVRGEDRFKEYIARAKKLANK